MRRWLVAALARCMGRNKRRVAMKLHLRRWRGFTLASAFQHFKVRRPLPAPSCESRAQQDPRWHCLLPPSQRFGEFHRDSRTKVNLVVWKIVREPLFPRYPLLLRTECCTRFVHVVRRVETLGSKGKRRGFELSLDPFPRFGVRAATFQWLKGLLGSIF